MNAEQLFSTLTARGVRFISKPPKLRVTPADRLSAEERELIRLHKNELLRLLGKPEPAPAEPTPEAAATPEAEQAASTEPANLTAELLLDFADALAIHPRSPTENDLALSRCAALIVAGARALRGARSPDVRRSIEDALRSRCTRACELLRTGKIMSADVVMVDLKRELTKLAGH
jgi:hypothetical protein